jgi:hypothetical protein
MPDVQTLWVYAITGAFVAFGVILLAASLWAAKAPAKKKPDSRAA